MSVRLRIFSIAISILIYGITAGQTPITITWGEPDAMDCDGDGEFNRNGNVITIFDIEGSGSTTCEPCRTEGSTPGVCDLDRSGGTCAPVNSGPATVSSNLIDISQFQSVDVSIRVSSTNTECNACNVTDRVFIGLTSTTKSTITQIDECAGSVLPIERSISVDCGEMLTVTVGGKVNSTTDNLVIETTLTGVGINTQATPVLDDVTFSNPQTCPGDPVTVNLDLSNCDAGCTVSWTPLSAGGTPLSGTSVTPTIPDNAVGTFDYEVTADNGSCMPLTFAISIPLITQADVEAAIVFPAICVSTDLVLPNPIDYNGSLISGTWDGSFVTNNVFSPITTGPEVLTFRADGCGMFVFSKTVEVAESDLPSISPTKEIIPDKDFYCIGEMVMLRLNGIDATNCPGCQYKLTRTNFGDGVAIISNTPEFVVEIFDNITGQTIKGDNVFKFDIIGDCVPSLSGPVIFETLVPFKSTYIDGLTNDPPPGFCKTYSMNQSSELVFGTPGEFLGTQGVFSGAAYVTADGFFDLSAMNIGLNPFRFTDNNCSENVDYNIEIYDTRPATPEPIGPFCQSNDVINLDSFRYNNRVNGLLVDWSGPSVNEAAQTIDISQPVGSYTITFAPELSRDDQPGCITGSLSFEITSITFSDISVCDSGSPVDLNGLTTDAIPAGGSYTEMSGMITSALSGPDNNMLDPTGLPAGNYTMQYVPPAEFDRCDNIFFTLSVDSLTPLDAIDLGQLCNIDNQQIILSEVVEDAIGRPVPGSYSLDGADVTSINTDDFMPGNETISFTPSDLNANCFTSDIQFESIAAMPSMLDSRDTTICKAGGNIILDELLINAGNVMGTYINNSASGNIEEDTLFNPALAAAGAVSITYDQPRVGGCIDAGMTTMTINVTEPAIVNVPTADAEELCPDDPIVDIVARVFSAATPAVDGEFRINGGMTSDEVITEIDPASLAPADYIVSFFPEIPNADNACINLTYRATILEPSANAGTSGMNVTSGLDPVDLSSYIMGNSSIGTIEPVTPGAVPISGTEADFSGLTEPSYDFYHIVTTTDNCPSIIDTLRFSVQLSLIDTIADMSFNVCESATTFDLLSSGICGGVTGVLCADLSSASIADLSAIDITDLSVSDSKEETIIYRPSVDNPSGDEDEVTITLTKIPNDSIMVDPIRVCQGDTYDLTTHSTIAGLEWYLFYISETDNLPVINPSAADGLATQTNIVAVLDGGAGCINQVDVMIDAFPIPAPPMLSVPICDPANTGAYMVTFTVPNADLLPDEVYPEEDGVYTVANVPIGTDTIIRLTDMTTGCTSSFLALSLAAEECEMISECSNPPAPPMFNDFSTTICDGDEFPTITISNTDPGVVSYNWFDENGMLVATADSFQQTTTGELSVQAFNIADSSCVSADLALTGVIGVSLSLPVTITDESCNATDRIYSAMLSLNPAFTVESEMGTTLIIDTLGAGNYAIRFSSDTESSVRLRITDPASTCAPEIVTITATGDCLASTCVPIGQPLIIASDAGPFCADDPVPELTVNNSDASSFGVNWYDENDSIVLTGSPFVPASEGSYTARLFLLTAPMSCPESAASDPFAYTIDNTTTADFTMPDFCQGEVSLVTDLPSPGGIFSFESNPDDGASININSGSISNAVCGTTYMVQYQEPLCGAIVTKPVMMSCVPVITAGEQKLLIPITRDREFEIEFTTDGTPLGAFDSTGEMVGELCPSDREMAFMCSGDAYIISHIPEDTDVTIRVSYDPDDSCIAEAFVARVNSNPSDILPEDPPIPEQEEYRYSSCIPIPVITVDSVPILALNSDIYKLAAIGFIDTLKVVWFDSPVGGVALDTGFTYRPTMQGIYYADILFNDSLAGSPNEGIDLRLEFRTRIAVIEQQSEDPTFRYSEACDVSSLLPTVVLTPGGQFSLTNPPADGVSIDVNTGELINPVCGTPYTVTHVVGTDCPIAMDTVVSVLCPPELRNTLVDCNEGSTTYTISFETNGTPLPPSQGTLTGTGPAYTINDIPSDSNFEIFIEGEGSCMTNSFPLATSEQCACDVAPDAPLVVGPRVVTSCLGNESALEVMVPVGFTVNWYSAMVGGDSLGTGTSFIPPAQGTFYAETVSTNDATCISTERLSMEYLLFPRPVIDSNSVPLCDPETGTYSITVQSNGTPTRLFGKPLEGTIMDGFIISGLMPGEQFLLVVTNENNCESPTIEVNVPTDECIDDCLTPPNPPVVQVPRQIICELSDIQEASATVDSGFTVDWYDEESGGDILFTGLTFTPMTIDTFWAETSDGDGCISSTRSSLIIDQNGSDAEFTYDNLCETAIILPTTVNSGGRFFLIDSPDMVASINDITGELSDPVIGETYTIRYIVSVCAIDSMDIDITIEPVPAITDTLISCDPAVGLYSLQFNADGIPTVDFAGRLTGDAPNWTITGLAPGENVQIQVVKSAGCESEIVSYTVQDEACEGCATTPDPPTLLSDATINACLGDVIPEILTEVAADFDVDWYDESGAKVGEGTAFRPPASGIYTGETTNRSGCVSDTRIEVTVILVEKQNPAFSYVNDCFGIDPMPVDESVVTPGGSFRLIDQTPDGAVINEMTGEILNTVEGNSYTIRYVTPGPCPDSTELTVEVIPGPELSFYEVIDCDAFGGSYGIQFITDGSVFSSDGRTVEEAGDTLRIRNISADDAFDLIIEFPTTGCTDTINVVSDCECPPIPAPIVMVGDRSVFRCSNQEFPALMASVDEGFSIEWYNAGQGGTLLGTGLYQPDADGDYFAQAVDANGCTSERRTAVIVNTIPFFEAGNGFDLFNCQGDTIALRQLVSTQIGDFVDDLDPNTIRNDSLFTRDLPFGDYQIFFIIPNDGEICFADTAFFNINVRDCRPPGDVDAEGTPPSCNGEIDGRITFTIDPEQSDYRYEFERAMFTGITLVNVDPVTLTSVIPGLRGDIYTINSYDESGAFVGATVVDLTDPPLLELDVVISNPITCSGDGNAILQANPSGGTQPYSYLWDDGEINQQSPNRDTGQYFVTVTDMNGCAVTDSIRVTDTEPLSYDYEITEPLCPDFPDGSIRFLDVVGGTPPYTYTINRTAFQGDSTFAFVDVGSYNLNVRDASGCFAVPEDININDYTAGSITLIDEKFLNPGETYEFPLEITGITPAEINWAGPGLSCTDCARPSIVATSDPALYAVEVIDVSGCTFRADIQIQIWGPPDIYIPNSIDRESMIINERGTTNRFFYPLLSDRFAGSADIMIYDRWGTLIFDLNGGALGDPDLGWDGTLNGEPVEKGPYHYVMRITIDGRTDILEEVGTVVVF